MQGAQTPKVSAVFEEEIRLVTGNTVGDFFSDCERPVRFVGGI